MKLILSGNHHDSWKKELDQHFIIDNPHYTYEINQFLQFIENNNLELSHHGLLEYIDHLNSNQYRRRYTARTYNKKLSACKKYIKYLFEKSKYKFDSLKKFEIESALKKIKSKKINTQAVSKDQILSNKEIKLLIQEAHPTIALMIRFLANTGLRVSEMLFILLSDIKPNYKNYKIRILGKGNKERFILVEKKHIQEIKSYFEGKTYLFEHNNKTYSRISVTNRIRKLGQIVLERNISCHTFRHTFATNMLEKTKNLKGISTYLGHSSISTTSAFYIKSELVWEDIKQLAEVLS